jgi:hypothetical protein
MRAIVAICTVMLGPLSSMPMNAAEVYIDPSRATGCPGSGLETDPYCDWRAVRNYLGGNRYLQKSGTVYRRSVQIVGETGASPENPIFIGGYGIGPRPTIRIENPLPRALDPKSWRRSRRHVWAYSTAGFRIGDPAVLLLDGRRAFGKARQEQDLCAEQGTQIVEWFHADETLSLCSPRGNPAEVYASISGMQRARGLESWVPVYLEDQHHVVIDGFALEGGNSGAVEIRGRSSDIEIRNSVIGMDSASGIRAYSMDVPITNIDIHDNVIDSGIRWGAVAYEPVIAGEGVHLLAGVQDSRIHRNVFVAWSHNGIYLDAHLPGSPGVNRNRVYDNEFHCGPGSSYFDYCRPFGIDGFEAGYAQHNVVFNNRMHDFSVAAQVNGNNNYMVGNTCYRVSNSKTRRRPTGQCFSLQPYQWSRDNLVANNTMAYTADVAIQLVPGEGGVSSGHRVVGNILYSCGLATSSNRRDACIAVSLDASVGPQTLIGNLMYNPGRSVSVLYRRDWSEEAGRLRSAHGDTVEENRVADPRFRDPEQADFALLPDSPAIEAGRLIEVPGLIFTGTSVNSGAWQSSTAGQAGWSVAR